MRYPVKDPADWKAVGRLSLKDRIGLLFREQRFRKRAKPKDGIAFRNIHRATRPLANDDVVMICVAKNAAKYVPSLLAHYRGLGVARFAFLDDNSDDGTRELLRQPDVDVFESNVNFRQAGGGLVWRDMLVGEYGLDRWYISIDSDEYLVFPGCETRSIKDFAADLKRHGLKRSLAVMIDIYPDGPLTEAPAHEPADASPTVVCPLHDGDGYEMFADRYCLSVRGGPRLRLFDTDMRLNKFPLVYMDRWSQFNGGSHHGLFPIWRNFSAVHAVLLHYKFPADTVADFRAIAERGMHANGSSFYKSILDHPAFGNETDFRYEGSMRFEDSETLVSAGFMQDLRPLTDNRS